MFWLQMKFLFFYYKTFREDKKLNFYLKYRGLVRAQKLLKKYEKHVLYQSSYENSPEWSNHISFKGLDKILEIELKVLKK